MLKAAHIIAPLAFLLASSNAVAPRFAHLRPVEAYEVRPGVLMLPRYSIEGQFCEVELESLHYSSGRVNLGSNLTPEKVTEIFDEFVPANERSDGGLKSEPGKSGAVVGGSVFSTLDYQKVQLQSYFAATRTLSSRIKIEDELVAIIIWKDRKCK